MTALGGRNGGVAKEEGQSMAYFVRLEKAIPLSLLKDNEEPLWKLIKSGTWVVYDKAWQEPWRPGGRAQPTKYFWPTPAGGEREGRAARYRKRPPSPRRRPYAAPTPFAGASPKQVEGPGGWARPAVGPNSKPSLFPRERTWRDRLAKGLVISTKHC